jgi:hypothetical protein
VARLIRLIITGKCNQKHVGTFTTEKLARAAFATALADVPAFLSRHSRGPAKKGTFRVS